jgi:hypothetical protein
MHADLNNMLEASIELELKVAKLYLLFYHNLPQDIDFWWNLMLEEQNHAALLRSIKDVFVPRGSIPENMVAESLGIITRSCEALQHWHQHYSDSPPSRVQAFNLALGIEHSAAELHFQRFMDKTPDSKVEEVFQQLNAEDKDHAQRLIDYMDAHNIVISPEICDPAEI